MTTQETIDKFLTDELFGECWHNAKTHSFACSKCLEIIGPSNHNKTFHSRDGFWDLWEKMQERDDWSKFCTENVVDNEEDKDLFYWESITKRVGHQTFPRLVAEWLGWKEDK